MSVECFKDKNGTQHDLTLTVGSVARIKTLTSVDIYKITDNKAEGLIELLENIPKFVDVIYALCKPSLDAKNVSDTDFGESLTGDSIEQAMNAFLKALENFSPRQSLKASIRGMASTLERAEAKTASKIEAKMMEVDSKIDEFLEKEFSERFGG